MPFRVSGLQRVRDFPGSGAVEVTRTPDRRFRKPLLYPAELPPQNDTGSKRGNLRDKWENGQTKKLSKTPLDLKSSDSTVRPLSRFPG
jgi:hypothetical protein